MKTKTATIFGEDDEKEDPHGDEDGNRRKWMEKAAPKKRKKIKLGK